MSFADRPLRLATGLCTIATTSGRLTSQPPVVLLHAWAESRRAFCRFTPRLPPDLGTVAVDLRGHGDADQPVDGYLLADLAEDVIAVLDALDVERAVLVGASSGGYVAQQVGLDHPGRVAGLVLAGSPLDLSGGAPFADEVEALTDPLDPGWVRAFVTGFASPRVPRAFLEVMVADALRLPARVWRDSLAGLVSSRPPTDVAPVRAPGLVVRGDRDELLDAVAPAELARRLPGATLVEYEDTGHAVLWERPGRLAEDVAAFVASLPR